MKYELKRVMLQNDEIRVEQKRKINFRKNPKYKRIVSSIKNIGLIEPLCVYQEKDTFILLDGYLRLMAAQELNMAKVPCFIYQSRDSFTFNAMRNELSPSQESHMINRAISQGVDEKDLSTVLNISVEQIRQTQKYADRLIPEARNLLDNNRISRSTAKQLIRVNEKGQSVILKKMEEMENFNASHAKLLVLKTPKEMMRSDVPPRDYISDHPEKRLYSHIKKGNQEIEFYAERYKENMKEFMKQLVFFRTLLEKKSTSKYLLFHYPQIVRDVKGIINRSETEVLS